MGPVGLLVVLFFLLAFVYSTPSPGHSYHHVRHRIHVPQKIKTVYHTKVVKVPEHHHYYHEKEKIVPVHIEKEKFVPVPVHIPEEKHPIYPPLDDHFDGHSGHENLYDEGHNILKKHATSPQKERKKQRRVRKS